MKKLIEVRRMIAGGSSRRSGSHREHSLQSQST
jgi:hypothetical protein